MKTLLAIIPVMLLSGCLTIPIPPVGEEVGQYGVLKIGVEYVAGVKTAPYINTATLNDK
jgi:hypothetical protein